jgi:hypothetical protein
MKSINVFNVLKLAAAFALAIGAHFLTPDAKAQALAEVVAVVVIAQANRGLRIAPRLDPSAEAGVVLITQDITGAPHHELRSSLEHPQEGAADACRVRAPAWSAALTRSGG